MSPQAKTLASLGALLVAAGGLGLYAYFGVMKADEAEAERKETSEKLFAAHEPGEKLPDGGTPAPAEFSRLTVLAKGDTTTLEKKDGKWRVTAPVAAPADESTVATLVGQLNNAKVKATVEEQPTAADLTRYGLDKPRFTVKGQASVPDGKGGTATKEVSLQGGIENTFDGSVYLRKGDDPRVYAVEGSVRVALEKSSFELRDKDVLVLDEGKLSRLEVKARANGYTLERDDKKAWRVTKPVAMPADSATVTGMLSSLKGERALSFPADSPEDRKRLGLEAPAVDATFTLEGGEQLRLRLAKAMVDGAEKAYALREESGGALLAEVSVGALAHLDKPAQELRDKAVLTFDKDQVARVAFTPAGGGKEIVVQKAPPTADAGSPDDWVVVAPEKGPARKWKMSSLLWTLGSFKASAFGPERPRDWSQYGIGDKSRTATLYDAQGKVLARLQVGKEVPGKTNTAYVHGTNDQVLEMDTSRLGELPSTPDDVLDKPTPAGGDGGTALQGIFGSGGTK